MPCSAWFRMTPACCKVGLDRRDALAGKIAVAPIALPRLRCPDSIGVRAVKEQETDISPVRRRNHGRILATCWGTLSQIMLRNGNVLRPSFATQETCGTLGSSGVAQLETFATRRL